MGGYNATLHKLENNVESKQILLNATENCVYKYSCGKLLFIRVWFQRLLILKYAKKGAKNPEW